MSYEFLKRNATFFLVGGSIIYDLNQPNIYISLL
jgi:hypothetical protein